MIRPSQRDYNQLRPIQLTRCYTKHAEGSVLVEYGDTKIICTASIQNGVPHFLKGKKTGWLTAEYGMLPRSTHQRLNNSREKPSGRTQEIQRLIGRALRSSIDLSLLGEHTLHIDCDVIQADGGTRTASITGACVAVQDAIHYMLNKNMIAKNPLRFFIASVSVGIYQGTPILDLDYEEDSKAETDMNIVMADNGHFIEIQGTAEGKLFSQAQLSSMLDLAKEGINTIFTLLKAQK